MHLEAWLEYEKKHNDVMIVNYEDLINTPYNVYLKIHEKFFNKTVRLKESKVDFIKDPVGLLPNKAIKDAWKEVFDKEDLEFFFNSIPKEIMKRNYEKDNL